MKKKVALLLVLSMILSMLPMNVFGASTSSGSVSLRGSVQEFQKFSGDWQLVKSTIFIDRTAISTQDDENTTAGSLRFELTNTDRAKFFDEDDKNGIKPSKSGAGSHADFDLKDWGIEDSGRVIEVAYTNKDEAVIKGDYLAIDLQYYIKSNETGTVELYVYNVPLTGRHRLLNNANEPILLADISDIKDYSIKVGDVVEFADSVFIKDITITELDNRSFERLIIANSPGEDELSEDTRVLAARVSISTSSKANDYFSFAVNNDEAKVEAGPLLSKGGFGPKDSDYFNYSLTGGLSDKGDFTKDSQGNRKFANYEVGTIAVVQLTNNEGIQKAMDYTGAGSIYIKNLKLVSNENARIDTKIRLNVELGTLDATDGVGNAKTFIPLKDHDATEGLHVATFVDYGLETKYEDKYSPSDYEVTAGRIDQETVGFWLSETTANSWGASHRNPTTFSVDENVIIQSAAVKLKFNGDDAKATDMKKYEHSDLMLENVNNKTQDGFVKLTPQTLTVTPTLSEQSVTNDKKYELYVELKVSAMPDFKGDTIEVTLGGAALENTGVGGEGKTFDIADVMVPITVETSPLDVDSNTSNIVAVQEVNDFTIRENYGGALLQGTELWLYADSKALYETGFDAMEIKGTGGIIVGKPKKVTVGRNTGIRFEITRGTSDNDEGGTIVISGPAVSCLTAMNMDYNIVVSGNAVAENVYDVAQHYYNASMSTGSKSFEAYRPDLFDMNPYSAKLFSFNNNVFNTIDTSTNNEINNSNNSNSGNNSGYTPQPFAVSINMNDKEVLSNGKSVSPVVNVNGSLLVSVRYLSDKFGLQIDGWDNTTKTATISGNHKQTGQYMTMNFTKGQVVTDALGRNVTNQMYNDTLYVAVRYVADAFGINSYWDDTTKSATFSVN